jgi:hypothetical protein
VSAAWSAGSAASAVVGVVAIAGHRRRPSRARGRPATTHTHRHDRSGATL